MGRSQANTLPALYPAQQIALGHWPTYDGYRRYGALDQVEIHDRVMALEAVRAHYNQMPTLPVFNGTPETEVIAQPPAYNQIRSLMVQRLGDTDPFGNTIRESYNSGLAGDTKEPHQFTGQEREHGTGLTYMGGRWYMPAAGRFLQVDPQRELVNSYSYVANNPIKYVDPDGEALRFHENSSINERKFILEKLQKLTDHRLSHKKGVIFIKEEATEETRPNGNKLIQQILATPFMNTIRIHLDKESSSVAEHPHNHYYNLGSKADITINREQDTRVYVKSPTSNKSVMAEANIPMHIAIAHELIHAYRSNLALTKPEQWVDHKIEVEGQDKPVVKKIEVDELATIGIGNINTKNVTENQIREEHNLPERRDH